MINRNNEDKLTEESEKIQQIRSKYSCAFAILSALFFLLLGILLVLLYYKFV